MEKILTKRNVIIASVVLLLLIVIVAVAKYVSKPPAEKKAVSEGWTVQETLKSESTADGTNGWTLKEIKPIKESNVAISSMGYSTEEEAIDWYKRSKESMMTTLGDTMQSSKQTKTAYILEDENFIYIGALSGTTVLSTAVDKNKTDEVNAMKKAFEDIGCDLPK